MRHGTFMAFDDEKVPVEVGWDPAKVGALQSRISSRWFLRLQFNATQQPPPYGPYIVVRGFDQR